MVFQDPLTSLNPLLRIGDQLVETILTHTSLTPRQARDRAIALLTEVGIPAPEKRIDGYPHEFSGGMRQRVVIALALCAEPALVIADEPTTALDVSVQAQIIAVLKRLAREHDAAVILITHDMGVIAETADRVAVMYAGRIAEVGRVDEVCTRSAASLRQGIDGRDPHARRAGLAPRPDSGRHAAPFGHSAGMCLQPALPQCLRSLPHRAAAVLGGRPKARGVLALRSRRGAVSP